MAKPVIKFNRAGWNEVAKRVIETEGVDRMKRVADACNAALDDTGYLVSVEGDEPLQKRDYSATVITATAKAQRDNAKHNRLIQEFHRAGGG